MTTKAPYTCILAPNASLLTGPGTNTLLIGHGAEGASVIDPATDDEVYLETIVQASEAHGGLKRIIITHGHPDHIGGALTLRKRLGIYIYAFNRLGTPIADEEVADGTLFPAGDDVLRAIHTPGHRFDHLCFYLEKQGILFAGDLLAGTGTVVIIPPEGDMFDYMQSLERLQRLHLREIVPAHGPIITQPQEKIAEYLAHRRQREQQILTQLHAEQLEITEIVSRIYTEIDPGLQAFAAKSVEAHLLKLESEGHVQQINTQWALKNNLALDDHTKKGEAG